MQDEAVGLRRRCWALGAVLVVDEMPRVRRTGKDATATVCMRIMCAFSCVVCVHFVIDTDFSVCVACADVRNVRCGTCMCARAVTTRASP